MHPSLLPPKNVNNRYEGKAPKKESNSKGSNVKCFSSSHPEKRTVLYQKLHTFIIFLAKTKNKENQSKISHEMEDETHSVSYHSDLTL